MNFTQLFTSLPPGWARDTNLKRAWLGLFSAALDGLLEDERQGVAARFPSLAPADALDLLGAERLFHRYPTEPVETWRSRILGAFDYWQMAGTLPGMVNALASAGYRATITEHWRAPDPARWAEFSVTVSPLNPLPNNANWNGQRRWGDGARWGVDPNAVPTDSLADLIREVKPAHARLRTLTYYARGRFWGGSVEWGEDREASATYDGWGLDYGLPENEVGTDSGPRWGAEPGVVLYQMEG